MIRELIQRISVALLILLSSAAVSAHDIEQLELDIRQLAAARFDHLDGFQVASRYGLLGIEHILSGVDHLMFVLSLAMLLGFGRHLVVAITGFTVAHSLTLALGALDWVRLPAGPVEAWIALSIVMVSAEALSERDSVTRRFPFIVPLVIGLIHGLGFAGALSEVGLPGSHWASALLSFNLGVELGQLGVIGLGWLVAHLMHGQSWSARARWLALSVFGSVAAWWTIERVWLMTVPRLLADAALHRVQDPFAAGTLNALTLAGDGMRLALASGGA